eukprot:5386725-Amphidinium_carterae.1
MWVRDPPVRQITQAPERKKNEATQSIVLHRSETVQLRRYWQTSATRADGLEALDSNLMAMKKRSMSR